MTTENDKAPTQGERITALEETVRGLSSTMLDLVAQGERITTLEETGHMDLVAQVKSLAADLAMLVDAGAPTSEANDRDVWIDRVLNKYHANDKPKSDEY